MGVARSNYPTRIVERLQTQPTEAAEEREVQRAARGRVLVVDDDADLREVLVEVLGSHGFEAYPAASYEEAVAVARAWPPDAAVCDLHGTGHPAQLAATTPVLLCSASGDDYLAAAARRFGAVGALRKPYSVAELVAALDAMRPTVAAHAGRVRHGRGAA
jgi:CheY-like chemotaxis protein